MRIGSPPPIFLRGAFCGRKFGMHCCRCHIRSCNIDSYSQYPIQLGRSMEWGQFILTRRHRNLPNSVATFDIINTRGFAISVTYKVRTALVGGASIASTSTNLRICRIHIQCSCIENVTNDRSVEATFLAILYLTAVIQKSFSILKTPPKINLAIVGPFFLRL